MTPDAPAPANLRADARRNRAHVLEVASEMFANEGLSVPVHEIARRAGVGTGTVSRHFPTKEALFEAIVLSRIARLVDRARLLGETKEPAEAFADFFAYMVHEAATNRGLAEAFAGAGFDIDAAAAGSQHDVTGAMGDLLRRAQEVGAVRKDIDVADANALVMGCLARERTRTDADARDRMIAIVYQGLKPPPEDN
jgi:AcrR family transcriptional regulator